MIITPDPSLLFFILAAAAYVGGLHTLFMSKHKRFDYSRRDDVLNSCRFVLKCLAILDVCLFVNYIYCFLCFKKLYIILYRVYHTTINVINVTSITISEFVDLFEKVKQSGLPSNWIDCFIQADNVLFKTAIPMRDSVLKRPVCDLVIGYKAHIQHLSDVVLFLAFMMLFSLLVTLCFSYVHIELKSLAYQVSPLLLVVFNMFFFAFLFVFTVYPVFYLGKHEFFMHPFFFYHVIKGAILIDLMLFTNVICVIETDDSNKIETISVDRLRRRFKITFGVLLACYVLLVPFLYFLGEPSIDMAFVQSTIESAPIFLYDVSLLEFELFLIRDVLTPLSVNCFDLINQHPTGQNLIDEESFHLVKTLAQRCEYYRRYESRIEDEIRLRKVLYDLLSTKKSG